MQVICLSSRNERRRCCPVRAVVIFAAAGIALQAQSTQNCEIRSVQMVRTIDLDACRPKPVSAVAKAAFLQSLPTQGAVKNLGAGESRKLDAIRGLLRMHDRDTVYELRVITVPQAWMGLYGRTVLLISLPALRLLDSGELQSLVAHEIGHEYVWQQFTDAKSRNDSKRLRELELVCDAIAVQVLIHDGMSPESLKTAIGKLDWYNLERLGRARDQNNYPSLEARRQIVKEASLFER